MFIYKMKTTDREKNKKNIYITISNKLKYEIFYENQRTRERVREKKRALKNCGMKLKKRKLNEKKKINITN